MKVRIKVGKTIIHDQSLRAWPVPGVDPDMEFDAEWCSPFWDCRSDDYGRKEWEGETGGYGNGSIFAFGEDAVEATGS